MYSVEEFRLPGTFSEENFHSLLSIQSHACLFTTNRYADDYGRFSMMGMMGCVEEIAPGKNCLLTVGEFYNSRCRKGGNYAAGIISYDLKNEIEKLSSRGIDYATFPLLHFFIPEYVFLVTGSKLQILTHPAAPPMAATLYNLLVNTKGPGKIKIQVKLNPRISKQQYIESVQKIKQHIQAGNIYELNYCQEFFAETKLEDPMQVFLMLNKVSPAPMASFIKLREFHLMSFSPERFLQRHGNRMVSQPMKGTAKRSRDSTADQKLKKQLRNSEKEQCENVMITDLVRNDLSRIAQRGSVKVEELFKINSLPTVHQMVTSVSCRLSEDKSFSEILKATFPMGSMTGAPKIRAMQLIDEFETVKRGLFSGAAGYMLPGGDFDFSVIIRSLLYNASSHYLSLSTGSAITALAEPETEYSESLLKAQAIRNALMEY